MFTVLHQISWPGSADRPNEDACGTVGDWAWVIDTSIFPGTPSFMHPQSDAAWLAGFANERFTALAPTARDGPALVRRVMQDCRDAFLSGAAEDRRNAITWPVGALTLVRGQDGRLEVWTFADTSAFVRHPDGTVVTLGDAQSLRRSESDMAAVLLRQAGCSPKDLLRAPAFLAWLADRREVQEQGGGVPLFGLQPETAGRLRRDSVSLPPGTNVLLTSDGFSALVDLYKHLDAKALMETALTSGLEPLAVVARHIETEVDPDAQRFPRFKLSDDATALLLGWETSAGSTI
jgi:Protein phosphatase 2C